MAAKVDIKKSMTSHRTWVNDAIKRAEKFLGDNPDGLVTTGDQEATKKLIEKIEDKLASLEKKWNDVFVPQLEVEDPNKLLDVWDGHVHDVSKQAENTIDELRRVLKNYEIKGTVAGATSPTSPGSKRTLKVDTSFKPPILARSTNLEEFLTWENEFKGYHEMNKAFLATTTRDMRRLFITNLLDSKLQSALSNDKTITLATPLIANGTEVSILSWIKNYLLRHTPLFVRRYEYAMCKQKPKSHLKIIGTGS